MPAADAKIISVTATFTATNALNHATMPAAARSTPCVQQTSAAHVAQPAHVQPDGCRQESGKATQSQQPQSGLMQLPDSPMLQRRSPPAQRAAPAGADAALPPDAKEPERSASSERSGKAGERAASGSPLKQRIAYSMRSRSQSGSPPAPQQRPPVPASASQASQPLPRHSGVAPRADHGGKLARSPSSSPSRTRSRSASPPQARAGSAAHHDASPPARCARKHKRPRSARASASESRGRGRSSTPRSPRGANRARKASHARSGSTSPRRWQPSTSRSHSSASLRSRSQGRASTRSLSRNSGGGLMPPCAGRVRGRGAAKAARPAHGPLYRRQPYPEEAALWPADAPARGYQGVPHQPPGALHVGAAPWGPGGVRGPPQPPPGKWYGRGPPPPQAAMHVRGAQLARAVPAGRKQIEGRAEVWVSEKRRKALQEKGKAPG
jgi:hypothetical protein